MVERIVVVSGPVASGKSDLARQLCATFNGKRYSTHEMLVRHLGGEPDRRQLQRAGEKLDRSSKGSWVRDQLSRDIYSLEGYEMAVVDSARIPEQVEYLRESFGRRVTHIHTSASEKTLRRRYGQRKKERAGELPSYDEMAADPTEAQIERMREHADLVIDTGKRLPRDVLVRAARALDLLAGSPAQCVDAIVGGEYGSEGKGNIAFYLAPDYDLLIRVGGPNAGHKVFLHSGESYIHHHLPSGTRAGEAGLMVGPGNVINVEKLLQEIADCEVDQRRLTIDPKAMVIEKADIRREQGLAESIGSTKQGVGLTWTEVERRAEVPRGKLRRSERTSTTDKLRRVGEFEWDLLRRSALLNGPTDIALIFVDYLGKQNRDARRFDQLSQGALLFIEEVERVAGAQVSLVSTGFDRRPAIVDRRTW
jgi:adenylosuccinate synthase